MKALQRGWDRVWYQPIRLDRISLLARACLVLLALDACWLMLPKAAVYGTGGFNVAHFPWLDAWQPLPSPGLYIACMAWVAVFAWAVCIGMPYRLMLVAVAVSYTYAWSCSLLDSFQHHYFISLVLFALAASPTCQTADLGRQKTAAAWAFQLLGVTIAIMYVYAAVSKLESGWLGGETPAHWLETGFLGPWLSRQGWLTWSRFGQVVIGSEIVLAAGYLAAVVGGEAKGRWGHSWRLLVLAVALVLHAGIGAAGLRIGWFAQYMIVIAGAYFLPASWLSGVHRYTLWLPRRLGEQLSPRARIVGLIVLSGASAAYTAYVVDTLQLPGLSTGMSLLVVVTIGWLVIDRWFSTEAAGLRGLSQVAIGCAITTALLSSTTVRFEFLLWQGKDLEARGQLEPALETFDRAQRLSAGVSRAARAEMHYVRGLALRRLRRADSAIEQFQTALKLSPAWDRAEFQLAETYRAAGRTSEARQSYESVIAAHPRFATAHSRLGHLLAELGELPQAQNLLEAAIEVDPHLAEAHKYLGQVLLARRATRGAQHHLQLAIEENPLDPEAHYLMGLTSDLANDLSAASQHYRRAIELDPSHQTARFNLATVHARRDDFAAAIAELETLLELAPDDPMARQALENIRQIQGQP